MRMIDADAFEVISWSAKGQTAEYERGHDDGISFMIAKIDKQPTIDAIPVEWLREKMIDHPELLYSVTDGIQAVLDIWNEEQEAR